MRKASVAGICGMLAMALWWGNGGAALLGQQRWCIHGAQAAAHCCWKGIGGAFRRADGGVGGSTSGELWWGLCRASGRWQHIRGLAVA